MNHLIVTVGDSFSGRKFDLEVPKDVESRLGRMLKPGETLEEAGVWNGDILYLAQK